jgi:hypothetical protein
MRGKRAGGKTMNRLRRWHRWLGLAAAILFTIVAATGVWMQGEQIFGEDEAAHEALAEMVSPQRVDQPLVLDMAALERARETVAARYNGQRIAAIDWAIKAPTPAFVFHIDGADPVRVSVDAKTAAVIDVEPDGEDWVMRLHTGEIFGDGGKWLGLFWGLALIFMIGSGIFVYTRMLAARQTGSAGKFRGWRRYFWVVLPVGVIIGVTMDEARAGTPFLTDDPGFIASGWEVKLATIYDRNIGGTTVTAPVIDVNYTIVPHFKINLTVASRTLDPRGGRLVTGLADTDLKVKWRFLDENADSAVPALSIAPNVTIPTAGSKNGIGDGAWRVRLPVQAGKSFGKFALFAEGGYQFALGRGASDAVIYGFGGQYAVTPSWSVGAELNGSKLTQSGNVAGLLANFGTSVQVNKALQIQASLGRTVREERLGGSQLLAQFFLQWQWQ